MATLQQILGAKNLIGVIQSVKPGLPADLLPASFMTPTRTVEGNYGTYRKVDGNRKLARLAQYGSPSKTRQLKGVTETPVVLMHTLESMYHQPSVLMNLTNIENEQRQRLGQQEIARQTKDFKDLFTNLRVAATFSVLANGAIWFDGDGEMLPSSTGAVTTVDMQIPAGNKSKLNIFGTGPIIDGSWSTTSTKIHNQIKALKRAARKLTGYPITHAFYGANVLDYILQNTTLQTYMKHNPMFQEAIINGELPAGFLGLNWHPVDEAFYEQKDSSLTDMFGADSVTFTPEPSPDWYDFIEGTYPVPNDISMTGDATQAINNVMTAQGMFSYAQITTDPVAIKQVAGDTFMPVIKVPKAVFYATVK